MPWKELVKTALLGTAHSTLPEQTLQALQAQGIDVSKETPLILMEGAALYGQMRKAGFLLEQFAGELPPAADPAAEKVCSPKSAHHLHLILSGEYEAVLPAFISLLLKNGQCLPPEHLPALLGRPDAKTMWEQIHPAFGVGGRWLLAQHPEWSKWLTDFSKTDWRTGSKEARLSLIRHLRKNDPVVALETIQSTWDEEDYRDKAAFLAEMETGLNGQDEPFLETCLDDGRKEVRQVAARLLAKLPGSRLSGRMYHRAVAILERKRDKLNVNIPEVPDAAAVRDGIQKIHPEWKGGAKAAYLGQMVSAIEPDAWKGFFDKTPAEILSLFARSDWAGTLLKATTVAALNHKNQSWIDGLCNYWLENDTTTHWDFPKLNDLCAQASPTAFNLLALKFLKSNDHLPEEASPIFILLQNNKANWDDELSVLIINRFKNWLHSAKRQDWQSFHYKAFLKMAALRSSPTLFDTFHKGWITTSPLWVFWEKPVQEMLNTLLFRKEMAAELNWP